MSSGRLRRSPWEVAERCNTTLPNRAGQRRLISGPRSPLPVPRRVFDASSILSSVASAPSRDELILYVWKRSNVSDTQLAQAVLRVSASVTTSGLPVAS
jgi:hypothetical protein